MGTHSQTFAAALCCMPCSVLGGVTSAYTHGEWDVHLCVQGRHLQSSTHTTWQMCHM